MARTQIEHLSVKLPGGFDPLKHAEKLQKLIADKNGPGWEIDYIDPTSNTASVSRQAAIAEVTDTKDDVKNIRLARTTKPTDGEKVASKLEAQYEGFYLTVFEPYLGWATLQKLNDDTVRARGAIAVAIGVKPWEIQIKQSVSGGYQFSLPKSYVPSKHETKLQEVAESVIGQDGWYVKADAQKLRAEIIPADPPTFPAAIPFPLNRLKKADPMRSPFGVVLGKSGDKKAVEASIDWVAQAFALVAGTPGSGKSVTLNALIADALASGCEIAIADEPSKAIDFLWMKDFVRPGGWGCSSSAAAVAMLAMVYKEGQKRSRYLEEQGVVNWLDLPEKKRFKPILVVVDELSALLVADKPPTGIPKDHPLYLEAAENALLAATISSYITKIISQQRFVGVRMILSTQVTNNNTGVGPTLKAKIGHKILQGPNPSKAARNQAFNDETAVPQVPGNVRADAKVSKGVGVAELEGSTPFVYKSYYASTKDYRAELERLGVPTTTRPEPTSFEIAMHAPTLLDSDGEPAPRMPAETGGYGRNSKPPRREDGLSGAAAAAHDLKSQGGY